MGLERVGGDDHASEVEPGQQRGEGGNLLGGAANLVLGQHRAAGVVHRRQQMHRAAIAAQRLGAGAAQGLAVDGDRPPPAGYGSGTVLFGQPGADGAGQHLGVQAGQGAADGGLGGDGEVVGSVVAGAERGPDRLGRASAAQSAIAAMDRAPVRTAAAAMARMATNRWRRPRAARGSGTAAR